MKTAYWRKFPFIVIDDGIPSPIIELLARGLSKEIPYSRFYEIPKRFTRSCFPPKAALIINVDVRCTELSS